METLGELYRSLSRLCDKGTIHSYIGFYESLFLPFRERPVTLLEIGVDSGASLALWARYFRHPAAVIVGIDVADKRTVASPARFVLGDASTDSAAALLPPSCNIVIDDGSHELADQTRSFSLLWPKVAPGGLYVIEDVQGDRELAKLSSWHPELVPVDLRPRKGRYDDLLLVAYKESADGSAGHAEGDP